VTFDPLDPEVQELMAVKAEAQGVAVGIGRDRMAMPSIGQAVMARRAADPTTVLDDFDTEHEDMRRAARPAYERGAIYAAGAVVYASLPPVHYDPRAAQDAMRKMERQLLDTIRPVMEQASKAMVEFSVALKDVDVEAVALAFDVPVEMLTGKPDDARLARRRHGHAAVCPRHGPTKGGLCRKCQR
jgi:hypothetical protein